MERGGRKSTALPGGSEKAVGAVALRPEAQIRAADQRIGGADVGALERRRNVERLEIAAVRSIELTGDVFVFGFDRAAGRVDEATARLDEA